MTEATALMSALSRPREPEGWGAVCTSVVGMHSRGYQYYSVSLYPLEGKKHEKEVESTDCPRKLSRQREILHA